MAPRDNVAAVLALLASEVRDAAERMLRSTPTQLDALVRNIEGDVERLRWEVDMLLAERTEEQNEKERT